MNEDMEDSTPSLKENTEDVNKRLSGEYDESDTTVHPFNMSNITVVEKGSTVYETTAKTHHSYDGSDSGVEVVEEYAFKLHSSSQELHTIIPPYSCDSSIISCSSNCEEGFESCKNGDGTSEGGSESSSVAGSTVSRSPKTPNITPSTRKRSCATASKSKNVITSRSRSKTPATPKTQPGEKQKTTNLKVNSCKQTRVKSLSLNCNKQENTSSAKKKAVTPTNDGRWPSVNSKPAPLMSRSLRGALPDTTKPTPPVEKSATLPRRRREQSPGNTKRSRSRPMSRENSAKRILFKNSSKEDVTSSKRESNMRTVIYSEVCSQTALTSTDIESMVAGNATKLVDPAEPEKIDQSNQTDLIDTAKLQEDIHIITNKYNVLFIENETNKLVNADLQRQLKESLSRQQVLTEQLKEFQVEKAELDDFTKAEQDILKDCLKDSENEIGCLKLRLQQKDDECRVKNQENLRLQAQLITMEAKTKDLLKNREASAALYSVISRLEGLVAELVSSYNISEQELEESVFHNEAYSNSSSSPEATPEKSRQASKDETPTKSGSSFVSAVINALKNATTSSLFLNTSRRNSSADCNGVNILDSETEPTLMMEPVLEDVVIPDGYTQNMVSSRTSVLSSKSENYDFPTLNLFSSHSPLVDQVIEVDNIITKLLKVIRVIQLENDGCMNVLESERDQFKSELGRTIKENEMLSKEKEDCEIFCLRLKTEVQELMQRLSAKNNECDAIKEELNEQRTVIQVD